MGNSTFRALHEFLRSGLHSAKLSERTSEPISDQLWREISGEVGSHSYVFLTGKHAVIYTESPVWASLAYQKRETLLKTMRKKGISIETLKIRNQPAIDSDFSDLSTNHPIPLSEATSALLQETAAQTTSGELQKALLRLSRCFSKT